MEAFDIAIVGAGIAGASLAWRLAQPHGRPLRVALLERESQPGMHSTGRSAAMFMESYGSPQARALTRASRAFYMRPPPGFAEVPLLHPRGVLYVAQPGQETLLEQTFAELSATCPSLERVDAARALQMAPCLQPGRVLAALYEPDAMDIDVNALHQGFLRGFKMAGAESGSPARNALWTTAEVASAIHRGDDWDIGLTDGRSLQARTVVNAAGAWADLVAAIFGAAPVGLVPKRRSAFTFRAPAGVDTSTWPTVVGIDESYYFKPDAGQLLGSPANADPTHPHDVQPEDLDIALGIHAITEATTLQIARPTATWAGLRSFAPDGELVIGPDGAVPGFFWLAGQGGYGIQSAAGAGALACALLRGLPLSASLAEHGVRPADLSPQRLGLRQP